jgi:hypothetical protein
MTEEIKKLKEQRDAIDQRIAELEAAELKKATTFEEKLKVWYESDNGIELDWIPSKGEYPHLREYIDDCEFDRYREYDLREYFEDEIWTILNGNADEISEISEITLKAIEESVDKNLHSFTFDW